MAVELQLGRRAVHAQIAARLLASPGVWQTVGVYQATAADRLARHISQAQGAFSTYGAPGDYQTRTRPDKGGTLLEARYVRAATAPKSHIYTPGSADTRRVLRQIEHGEIRCGSDAARTIAARHEDAYGAAFHGTPAQALRHQLAWADALAALNPNGAA